MNRTQALEKMKAQNPEIIFSPDVEERANLEILEAAINILKDKLKENEKILRSKSRRNNFWKI